MIVVFGSINLDLAARVPRLPRAGETQLGFAFSASAGGKGANQALAARRAGSRVALYGAVGRDTFAEPALALLRQDGVDIDGVKTLDAPTGVALIHVDSDGQNTISVVPGANGLVDAASVPSSALGATRVVLMQLETPQSEVLALAERTRACGGRVILNAAPAQALAIELLSQVDVLIVNESEAATLGRTSSQEEFATTFAARFGCAVVVTLGANGLVAASRDARTHLPAPKVTVVDTVGAGDALVGALAAALDRGTAWPRALREGLAAGSLACTRPGAQAALPWRDEIAALADTI
jgi:ribokinase